MSTPLTVACLCPYATTNLLSSALVNAQAPDARVLTTLTELRALTPDPDLAGWVQLTHVAEMSPAVVQEACRQARALGLPLIFLHRGPVPHAMESHIIREYRPDAVLQVSRELAMICQRVQTAAQPVEA